MVLAPCTKGEQGENLYFSTGSILALKFFGTVKI